MSGSCLCYQGKDLIQKCFSADTILRNSDLLPSGEEENGKRILLSRHSARVVNKGSCVGLAITYLKLNGIFSKFLI